MALTGWGHTEDRERSKQVGFDGRLVKPIGPEALEGLLADVKPDDQTRANHYAAALFGRVRAARDPSH